MRCAHCGAEIDEYELYCPFCGQALPTGALSEAERLLVRKNTGYYGRHFAALRAGKKQLKHGCGGCSGDCSACPYHTDPTSGRKS